MLVHNSSHWRRRLLLGAILMIAVAMPAGQAAAAANHNPGVLPPQSHPFGMSYGQWSALWWQQAFAVHSGPGSPFEAGSVDCTSLGTRHVAFLVGTTQTSGNPASRSCSLPTGTAVLFPLINYAATPGDGVGSTEAELRANAREVADNFTDLMATVDGRALSDLASYRFQSPLFVWTTPSDNVFDVDATADPTPAVADGYWIMLPPLSPGVHTISFGGAAPIFKFTTATSYTITVTPDHH
jgi:hypothetical protein